MALKRLKDFMTFDFKEFVKDKELLFISAQELKEDKKIETGSKIGVLIMKDRTEYANGEVGVNKKMNFTIKTRQPISYFADWEEDDKIEVTDIERVLVYGDYSNELSVLATVENVDKKTTDKPVVKAQNNQ